MKVNESFAVEATEEVRKDPRFEWYVNWLRGLENEQNWKFYDDFQRMKFGIGIESGYLRICGSYALSCFYEILTLDEVFERYGKEIYEANGIEQPKDKYVLDLVNPNDIPHRNTCVIRMGSDLTHEEVKIMEDALNKQPFQGSREYDEKLLMDWSSFVNNGITTLTQKDYDFLNNRYPNESILKQIAEHKAKIEELKKQLK